MKTNRKSDLHSKWGSEDEIGALNEISPELIVAASKLVKQGRIFELSHVLENGIPSDWFHGNFQYSTFRRHEDSKKVFPSKNNLEAMNVRLEMADHTGTHLDSLNHVSIGGKMYNNNDSFRLTDTFGTSRLGVEKLVPIFTRGVLIDATSLSDSGELKSGYLITPDEIRKFLKRHRIEIRKGDAVLFFTGWEQYWMVDNKKFLGSCPGIGMESAHFLVERGVSVIGADTPGVEVDPSEETGQAGPVHQFLITKNGIILVENLKLDELRKEQIFEFLFACLPLKIKGGSGSPVSPIAII